MIIKKIGARVIKDSRGEPTIEVSVNGCRASSPSGKSKGKHETPSWHLSVDWNVNEINSFKFTSEINSFNDLEKLESYIKARYNFTDAKQFGANALFALESAVLKALAFSQGKELWQIINNRARKFPTPLGNVIGGGVHSSQFGDHPTFQEFLLAPRGNTFAEKCLIMKNIYLEISKLLNIKKINDEGALACSLAEEEIFTLLSKFREKSDFGADVASSSFYSKNGLYNYRKKELNETAQIDFINSIIEKFNPIYIEDPLSEEDFEGFSRINKSTLVCGDDLTTTSISRLKEAIKNNSINAMIIKPNQNGSLLEVKEIVRICKENNIATIISHRSGETTDNALADYAFGFQTDYIKCGIATKYREAKLNRLIEIEKNIN